MTAIQKSSWGFKVNRTTTKRMMGRWILSLVVVITLVTLAASLSPALANPESSIEITVTANITDWGLSPQGTQPKTETGTLTVTTTDADGKSWSVTASDADSENTTGSMTKYSNSAYVSGTKLGTAMQVQGPAGTVTLPIGGNVVEGTGNVTGTQYIITFKQTVLWSDTVVTDPDYYRIIVTFTGSIAP